MTIDLKTAVFGDTAHVRINTFGLCQECAGTGCQKGTQPTQCPECHGKGFAQRVVRTMLGQMMTTAPCERCEGHGTVIENPCPSCLGHGRVRTTRNVGVSIPAGIGNNTRLRLANQGEVARTAVSPATCMSMCASRRMIRSPVTVTTCIAGFRCP